MSGLGPSLFGVLALSIGIGVALGLLGGGGSILTVPILSYAAGMAPRDAIAASLFVVGVTSVAALVTHAQAGRVEWRTGGVFGAAGMVGGFGGGRLAGHVPGHTLMILFDGMMLVAAAAMIRPRPSRAVAPAGPLPLARAVGQGVLVGAVTSLVGAGGGFMVVPALVLIGGLSMPRAAATSLVVIAMQSFAGLAGHLGHASLDWPLTLAVTAVAVVGSVIGGRLAGRVSAPALRRGFGVFLIVMAAVVLAKELL